MSRPRRSRDEWREHIVAWTRSGLSGVDYARRQGLNPNTFAWWRSELRRERADSSPGLTLVPVRLTAAHAAGGDMIEVLLPDGVVIRVPEQADPMRAALLVRALVTAC